MHLRNPSAAILDEKPVSDTLTTTVVTITSEFKSNKEFVQYFDLKSGESQRPSPNRNGFPRARTSDRNAFATLSHVSIITGRSCCYFFFKRGVTNKLV